MNAVAYRRLRSLLRYLTASEQFSSSSQLIDVEGVGVFTATNLFIHLQENSRRTRGAIRWILGYDIKRQIRHS